MKLAFKGSSNVLMKPKGVIFNWTLLDITKYSNRKCNIAIFVLLQILFRIENWWFNRMQGATHQFIWESGLRDYSKYRVSQCNWIISTCHYHYKTPTACPRSKLAKVKGYILETELFWPLVGKNKKRLRTIHFF